MLISGTEEEEDGRFNFYVTKSSFVCLDMEEEEIMASSSWKKKIHISMFKGQKESRQQQQSSVLSLSV